MTHKDTYFFEIITEELPINSIRSTFKSIKKKILTDVKKFTQKIISFELYISLRRISFILKIKHINIIDIKKIIKNTFEYTKFDVNMRWGKNKKTFIRPIISYILAYNNTFLNHKLFNINSTNKTIPIKYIKKKYITPKINNYKQFLHNECKILCDFKDRQDIFIKYIVKYSKKNNAIPILNKSIINNISNSFEYPTFITLSFKQFKYNLPNKIIIKLILQYFCIPFIKKKKIHSIVLILDSIKKKYINTEYIQTINNKIKDLEQLYIAAKTNKIKKIHNINFYENIKVLIRLANKIKAIIHIQSININKLIILLKLEDITRFKNEYPEFHGLLLFKTKNIFNILNDYNRSLNNQVPKTKNAAMLLIINTINYIINTFDKNEEPTAKKDPYNFKKTVLIFIKTILRHKINISLTELFRISLAEIKTKQGNEILSAKIIAFILNRMQYNLINKNITFIKNKTNLLIIKNITKNLDNITKYIFQKDLYSMIKRIDNFCRKQKLTSYKKLIYKILEKIDEKILIFKLMKNMQITKILDRNNLHFESLKLKLSLKIYLDKFFKNVFILCNDTNKKDNRIKLIYLIKYYFNRKIIFNKYF